MPRPRLPEMKAKTSGADAKNPQRFRDRKTPKTARKLGEPYVRMTDEQKVYWAEIQMEMPWLCSADRPLVRLACQYIAMMDEGTLATTAASTLGSILSKLGATPTDRSKVKFDGDDEPEDPTESFFQ